jgi:hypothetical protein
MPDGSKYACVGKRDMNINSPPCLQFLGYQTICTPHDHPFCLPASTGQNSPELGLTIYDEQQGVANYYIISESGVSDPIALSPNTSITLDSIWFDQMQCLVLLSISLATIVFGVFCWLLGVVIACLFWRCYKRQAYVFMQASVLVYTCGHTVYASVCLDLQFGFLMHCVDLHV